MEVLGTDDDHLTVRVSASEAVLLANVLFEVCDGELAIPSEDFPGMFGAERSEAIELLQQFGDVLDNG